MRNEWTTIRIKHKVPGNRLDQKLAVGVPVIQKTESGYTHTTVNKWIHLEDLKLEEKFQMYKNNAMMFGTSTRLNDGTKLRLWWNEQRRRCNLYPEKLSDKQITMLKEIGMKC